MIISEDHIFQEELNNVTLNLLAHTYPLHLVINNIKNPHLHQQEAVISKDTTYRNKHFPHYHCLLRHRQIIHSHIRIGKQFPITPRFPVSDYLNLYLLVTTAAY